MPEPHKSNSGEPPVAVPAQNRRAHERHELDRTAVVSEIDESGIPGPSWECRVFDLSRSGLGLCSRRMSYTGRLLLIRIRETARSRARVYCGMVRQSRYESNEGHILGIQFWAMPKSAAVEQWVLDGARAA